MKYHSCFHFTKRRSNYYILKRRYMYTMSQEQRRTHYTMLMKSTVTIEHCKTHGPSMLIQIHDDQSRKHENVKDGKRWAMKDEDSQTWITICNNDEQQWRGRATMDGYEKGTTTIHNIGWEWINMDVYKQRCEYIGKDVKGCEIMSIMCNEVWGYEDRGCVRMWKDVKRCNDVNNVV